MKYPYYDPETNKEYMWKNEYEFKIKTFTETQECNFFDDEVIEYIISLKDEIIGELEIPSTLKTIKPFKYRSNKNSVGRPLGVRNKLTTKKYIWIRNRYLLPYLLYVANKSPRYLYKFTHRLYSISHLIIFN